jgi:hypothetical protein
MLPTDTLPKNSCDEHNCGGIYQEKVGKAYMLF